MKHLIRDSLIFLIDVLGISALYRMYFRRQGPLVRAIVFHDVADASWFKAVIEHCARAYHILTPEDFHTGKFDRKKINVLLTFDDGYQSWVDVCAPILAEANLKGLFFISSGLLEIAADTKAVEKYLREQLCIQPKKPLTWEGASALLLSGHTVGGHTVTHPNLALLTEEEASYEICKNKSDLEARLGVTVSDFAYPFGRKEHRNPKVLQLLRDAGFKNVYTAETGFMQKSDRELPRMCIEKNQPLKSIHRWIGGGYDLFRLLFT